DVAQAHVARVADVEPEAGQRAVHRRRRVVGGALRNVEPAGGRAAVGVDADVAERQVLDGIPREPRDGRGGARARSEETADRHVAEPARTRDLLIAAAIAEADEERRGGVWDADPGAHPALASA